jgi:hypothetical protein
VTIGTSRDDDNVLGLIKQMILLVSNKFSFVFGSSKRLPN